MFKNKSILITGGTGSLGKAFVKATLDNNPDIKRMVVFSRDELKQFEMSLHFLEQNSRESATSLEMFEIWTV